MKTYFENNMLRFCKAGIATMIFCIGVLPMSAQDDDAESTEEIAQMAGRMIRTGSLA